MARPVHLARLSKPRFVPLRGTDINAFESNLAKGRWNKKYPALSRVTDRQPPPSIYLWSVGGPSMPGGWSMRSKTNETWGIKAERMADGGEMWRARAVGGRER